MEIKYVSNFSHIILAKVVIQEVLRHIELYTVSEYNALSYNPTEQNIISNNLHNINHYHPVN